ncbi:MULTISPECIES: DUF5365 family protein [Heyndrickxia]|uniref:Uncharacterized protein n=1 Tax=Heyndrickxia sporothermodurans TaxID=46224 RepID=A0A150KML0_9BACI|nr:DUF5365 family protein [Heyndrickxia sporothermodurans]KYC97100.1 hypothetical protein B4102_0755 [Heyndrickxia sporothermodurans]PTY78458.1 hypothetical protein B5V89_10680 [Heyndrickxia sporothermodurans]
MKVLFASTKEQEEKINELVNYFYSDIFPYYYEDEEIAEFKSIGVLKIEKHHFEKIGTLKDAYQVIASLQTIIVILEEKIHKKMNKRYEELFNHNVQILNKFTIPFPFFYTQFNSNQKISTESFSIYKSAANEMLI